MVYVLLLVLVAPVAALVLAAVLVVTLVRTLHRRTWPSAAAVATVFGCLWLLVYAGGIATGELAVARAASDVCGPGRYDSPPLLDRPLPLSHRCQVVDGPDRELVPDAVNPLLAATAALGVATTALALLAGRRRAPGARATTDHPVPEGTP